MKSQYMDNYELAELAMAQLQKKIWITQEEQTKLYHLLFFCINQVKGG